METVNLLPTIMGRPEGLIDLNELVFLKRFAVVTLVSLNSRGRIVTPFMWLRNLLQDTFSTSEKQTLHELWIQVEYACSPGNVDIGIWKNIFNILVDDRFNKLEILRISVDGPVDTVSEVVKELSNCDDVEKLRSQTDLVVEVMGKPLSFSIDQDGFDFFRQPASTTPTLKWSEE